ncbi:monovalent cation/H(+) antiporter subunit G [Pseudaestuariivita sp.]|uniref:monovalent cation/H(+) antiporter subunit G n=1 Tax=Pseudaestuariivita sp. TaxID=2211669 RepID=UPI0040580C6A
MTEFIAAVFVIIGGVMSVFAGIGILRLPDVFIRMHAATKVGTLGSGLIIAGVAVHFNDPGVVLRCILIVFFLLLTAPIGAHMIGRAALRIGVKPWGAKDTDVHNSDS